MSHAVTVSLSIDNVLIYDAVPGDVPDFGLADGLTISRTTPNGDFWPVQPDPATCQVGLILEGFPSETITQLGSHIRVTCTEAGNTIEDFAGRIAAVSVEAVMLGPDPLVPGGAPRPAVLVSYVGVDYLADLAEQVPAVDIFEEQSVGMMIQIMQSSPWVQLYNLGTGTPWNHISPSPFVPSDADILQWAARPVSTESMAEALAEILRVWVMPSLIGSDPDVGRGMWRYLLQPESFVGAYPEPFTYELEPFFARTLTVIGTYGTLPDGSWGIDPVPSSAGDPALVLDAQFIDRTSGRWSRAKGAGDPSQVAITLAPVTGLAGGYNHAEVSRVYPPAADANGGAAGVARLDSQRFSVQLPGGSTALSAALARWGELYLGPNEGEAAGWVTYVDTKDWGLDTVTYRRSRDTGHAGQAFPPVGSDQLVTIAGVLDPWAPLEGRTWITGQLSSHSLTIANGEAIDTFTIRESPVLAGTIRTDPVLWSDVPAGVKWSDVAPADRWFEYGYVSN